MLWLHDLDPVESLPLLDLLRNGVHDVRQSDNARQSAVVNDGELFYPPQDHERACLHNGRIARYGDRRRAHEVRHLLVIQLMGPLFDIFEARNVVLIFHDVGIAREDRLADVRFGDDARNLSIWST
jgi:hypothetical protein